MGNCLVCKLDGVEKETADEALREDLKQKTQFSASKGQTGVHEVALGLPYRITKNKEGNVKSSDMVLPEEQEGVKRMRLVISKKELLQLLSKCQGNLVSLVDAIGELKSASVTIPNEPSPRLLGERWTPVLEAIPEDVLASDDRDHSSSEADGNCLISKLQPQLVR